LIWRILLSRYLVNHSRIQQLLRENIVIIGWSEQASKFAQALVKDELSLFHIVGWVKTETSLDPLILPNNVKCLGNYQNLESIMADQKVDTLLLADLDFSEEKRIRLSNFCIKNMVDFKISPTYSELLTKGMVVDLMNNLPVIDVTTLPLDKFGNRLTKRVLDIVGSLIGLVISLPLILIFGSIVYLESPGRVFYRQKRIGLNGKIIEIIKIRSMKLDAEKNGAKWASENDTRCLKIGRFIRKFNIDEIPQFWNVLKGEMSLVGPRPERPEFTTNFQDDIPHYNARNNALPGMSGLAQIKGLRGNTDLKKRLQQDIYYLENWSIWLDLYIILKTFTTVENAH
jgi:exopolysaccharide biosynthesis polyprenyl glycosylphosphotransferase